jgi:hypothetical protein
LVPREPTMTITRHRSNGSSDTAALSTSRVPVYSHPYSRRAFNRLFWYVIRVHPHIHCRLFPLCDIVGK